MKKPNWDRFNSLLYSWTVCDKFAGYVKVYRNGRKRARNSYCQILERIFDDYSFWHFKEARELVRKNKKYYIYYEKLMGGEQ